VYGHYDRKKEKETDTSEHIVYPQS
jgi:hypothetical protein